MKSEFAISGLKDHKKLGVAVPCILSVEEINKDESPLITDGSVGSLIFPVTFSFICKSISAVAFYH